MVSCLLLKKLGPVHNLNPRKGVSDHCSLVMASYRNSKNHAHFVRVPDENLGPSAVGLAV